MGGKGVGKYAGFDTDRVSSLRTKLANAASDASSIASTVCATQRSAEHYLMLGHGVPGGVRRAEESDGGQVTAAKTLDGLFSQGADTATEIGRRLAHLLGVQKVAAAGYSVDLSTAFEDSGAPDLAKIKAAADALHGALHDKALMTGGVPAAYDALKGLNGTEAEAVLGKLDDDELAKLNSYFGPNRTLSRVSLPRLSDGDRITLTNAIFPGMSTSMLMKLGQKVPNLQPNTDNDDSDGDFQDGLHYEWRGGGLIPTTVSTSDVNQGDIGDCWFLAALGAEVQKDPHFAANHIKDNGNGTYTVTLFKDGKETAVTVDSNLPVNKDGSTTFSHNPTGNSASWVQLYEKAYAQLNGGYGEIEGGWGDHGMKDLTGQGATKSDDDDVSFTDMADDLKNHKPVVVGSDTHHSGFLWHHSDETFPNTDVVTAHEYIVEEVDPDKHTIKLRNPWGSGSSVAEEITLTEDQFHDMFREVSVGDG